MTNDEQRDNVQTTTGKMHVSKEKGSTYFQKYKYGNKKKRTDLCLERNTLQEGKEE